jgi:hypothetical protein
MEQQPNSPHSENQPEWFAKVNDDSHSQENSPLESSTNRVIPIVAALAIVGAAAAYGINQKSDGSSAIDDTLVSQQSDPNQNSNLPAPTITGGPQGGPGQGVDPDGDNWTGANRHRDGKFDPNHPRPPHGDGDGFGHDDGPNGDD